ncbi:MAG: NUDIX domain-containing protein [Flavobacteriaceae bacterium]|nr:NUDIX domain-containing protein [Flavobacteriaceae bacterium]
MDEYIDIVTKEGKLTGKKTLKSKIHAMGYYHNTAHVWLYTKDKEILLAQRDANKSICPLLWDVSVAGHVDAGELIIQAAIREVKEEIGLDLAPDELHKIGVFECFQSYPNGIKDNEFHHTYIAELQVPISKLIPQIGEVESLKLVSFELFEQLLKHIGENNHFIPCNKAYYELVLNHIKNMF